MCILMYFGPNSMPIRAHLEMGCRNNPDGFGYAIVDRVSEVPRIIVGHGMDAGSMVDEFIAMRAEYPADSAIFHARITTDGLTCEDNCHPFAVGGDPRTVVGHNGILSCRPPKGDSRSDTRMFAEDIMRRQYRHLDSKKTRRRLEKWLGGGNKMVVLTVDPFYQYQSYIFNEQLGHWLTPEETDGDIWYSNTSHCERSYTSYYASGYGSYWPTRGRSTYVESWDSEDEFGSTYAKYSGYTYACVECGYSARYCACPEPVMRFLPSWQVRTPGADPTLLDGVDIDDPDTWTCNICKVVGEINPTTAQCRVCKGMWCCDQTPQVCRCWNDDGSVNVKGLAPLGADLEGFHRDLNGAADALRELNGHVQQTIRDLPALTVKPHADAL